MRRPADRTQALAYAALAAVLLAVWYGGYLTAHGFGVLDWAKDGYDLAYLKASLVHFNAPPRSFLAISQELRDYPTLAQSTSYWANPEMLTLSPLMIPLRWLSLDAFWRWYFLAHVVIACGGLGLLARRLRLGLIGATSALVLIGLNPWLIQHVAIGYTPWVTAGYAPLIVALLVGPRLRTRELALAAALDALIVYEGGLHVFVWLNLAIVLVTAVGWALRRDRAPAVRVTLLLAGTLLLTLPKLVASVSVYGGVRLDLLGSYASPADLWGLLTDSRTSLYDLPAAYATYGTNLYDGSTYVGIVFLLVAAWALAAVLRRRDTGSGPLLIAAGLLVVLGWDGVWKAIAGVVPLLGVERYPYRFLIIAVICVAWVIAGRLNAFARHGGRLRLALTVAALVAIAVPFAVRAHTFADVASGHPLRFGSRADTVLSDIHGLAAQAAGPGTRTAVSPSGVTVWPAPGNTFGSCIPVPWLLARYADDFDSHGGTLVPDPVADTVKLCPDRAGTRMTVEAKSYGRTPLLVLSAAAFAAFLLVVRRRRRTT